MIEWLPSVRRLISDLDRAAEARVRAEDLLRAKESECKWLREQLVDSQKAAIEATQAIANVGIQLRFGFKVFPEAPGVPASEIREESEPGILKPDRRQAFNARREAHERFVEEGMGLWQEAHRDFQGTR